MISPRSALVWLLIFAAGYPATGERRPADRRFLAGLRERGVYQLAETYCLGQIERPELSEPHRAELVIELSRCLAARAADCPPTRREPLWQDSQKVIDEFIAQHPENPLLPLVRLQGALGLLTRGELARQEAQVVANAEQLRNEARESLRAAIRRLRELAEQTQRRLQQPAAAADSGPPPLSDRQLSALLRNIRYQLARAYRNQAQCYDRQSPDQLNSLNQAVSLLIPLAKLDPPDALAHKSHIDLVICQRLLGEQVTAERMLDALEQQKLSPQVALLARAQRIRLALATGRLPEAKALLARGRQVDAVTSPELDYAWLMTHLALWRAAEKQNDKPQAAASQEKADKMVRWIESRHGPYWTRRAEMLLADYVRTSPGSSNLAMLVRAAESAYRSGQLDDALAAYDRARQFAADRQSAEQAFGLGYTAAAIEHRRGRHGEAMRRYRELATGNPSHPKAPQAHLLAVYHAAQLAAAQPQQAMKSYAEMLEEHLKLWPEKPTAAEVRRQQGRCYEHQRRWQEAIDVYRAAWRDDPNDLKAVQGAARCYRARLKQCEAAEQPTEPIASQAAAWLEKMLLGRGGHWPRQFSPLQQIAALEAARIRLHYMPSGHARAEQLLAAALDGAAEAPAEWKSAARTLLVFSLVARGRYSEAAKRLEKLAGEPPVGLLAVLENLGSLAAVGRPEVCRRLAGLQLRTIELLRDRQDRLSPARQRRLEWIHARAKAEALLVRGDRRSLEAARSAWRRLEQQLRPGSREWFRAKYWVAWTHCELGNRQQAAKMITLLKLFEPKLDEPEMQSIKSEFEKLLRRCQR